MSIFPSDARDLSTIKSGLQNWIRAQDPLLHDAEVTYFAPSSASAGYSNETYSLDLVTKQGSDAGKQRLILRTAPGVSGLGMFPSYDIPKQYHVMRAVEQGSSLPVPRCRWLSEDTSLFGAPFFFMERIDGLIPGDAPLYTVDSFVVDASWEDQRQIWDNAVDCHAALSKLDWKSAGLGFIDWPDRNRSRIAQHVQFWADYFAWAVRGEINEVTPEEARIRSWLMANLPVDEPACLLWGDGRFANFMYQGTEVVGTLDWELANIGNPMDDFVYFLLMDKVVCSGSGVPGNARPRIPGFRSMRETTDRFIERTGLSDESFTFYWVFNSYKIFAMIQRAPRMMLDAGMLSTEQAEEYMRGTQLREWIDLIIAHGPKAVEHQ